MAKRIEYLVGFDRNDYNDFRLGSGSWSAYDDPPEDLSLICHIRLDNRHTTEDVSYLTRYDAEIRWEMLVGADAELPVGLTCQTAVAFAEAIWLDTLSSYSSDELADSFNMELMSESERLLYEEEWEGTWETFAQIGDEAGVLHRITSWLNGVPLEDVLR